MSEAGRIAVLRLVEDAPIVSGGDPVRRKRGGAPPAGDGNGTDMAVVQYCAKLDQSDTDNATRLARHFGDRIAFVAQEGKSGGEPIGWTGKFWDRVNGAAIALEIAQRLGERIELEAQFLGHSEAEAETIAAAEKLSGADQSAAAGDLRQHAKDAKKALKGRRSARVKFGTSSKNSNRIENMLKMAGPMLRKPPELFNAAPLRVVTQSHTLQFIVEPDLDCPDPDVTRKLARVEAKREFERTHYMTGLIPCDYDPDARATKWESFLVETQPDPETRRTLCAYSGMGLLGKLAQRLMYHYGSGANGKSIFLSVLTGVLGDSLCVSLPKETITGANERGAGQAAPDLVRLFGKRMLRVDELKDGDVLREDLVKRMTGGDVMTVRNLFGGYFDFVNVATPHASGNGRPRIDGTDNGIWRRMLVMHWKVTIAEEKQRDFQEFVAELLTERSGILNWLIEGARDYLANGLYLAKDTIEATAEYREEMDPIGDFLRQCVETAPGEMIQAGRMYEMFCAWARAGGKHPLSETRVGRRLGELFKRDRKAASKFYLDIRFTADALGLMNHAPPPAGPEDS